MDKKDIILEAAIKVFSQKGFHLAKVEEIASEAGIGKGTVYEYFKSKKELFQEIFLWFMNQYMDSLRSQITPDMNPKKALSNILQLQTEFLFNHQEISTLIMNEFKEIDESFKIKIAELKRKNLNIIANYVEKGIEQGFFRQVNPLTAAILIENTIPSIVGMSFCYGEQIDKTIIEDLQLIIFKGLES